MASPRHEHEHASAAALIRTDTDGGRSSAGRCIARNGRANSTGRRSVCVAQTNTARRRRRRDNAPSRQVAGSDRRRCAGLGWFDGARLHASPARAVRAACTGNFSCHMSVVAETNATTPIRPKRMRQDSTRYPPSRSEGLAGGYTLRHGIPLGPPVSGDGDWERNVRARDCQA